MIIKLHIRKSVVSLKNKCLLWKKSVVSLTEDLVYQQILFKKTSPDR